MVQKKAQTAIAIRPEACEIVQAGVTKSTIALPDLPEFREGKIYEGLAPTVEWEKPGQFVFGKYVTREENVGPNASRIYKLDVGGIGIVSVWGSTILDKKMDEANPAIGQRVCIQYLGTVPTKRGLSDAKDFRVIVASK